MFVRTASQIFDQYLKNFPAVVITGARQVGKTTFVKTKLKKTHRYVLLEEPDIRALAIEDPRSFLARYPPPVIFDEFQYVPQLTSYLQGLIDNHREQVGDYILTGSQNFLMMEQVSQSLAGRVGILSLYGLHTEEIPLEKKATHQEKTIAEIIFRGSFPELWQKREMEPAHWFGSYLRTYLERDVRNITQVGDLVAFERFIRLCAIRTGQLLNISHLARDGGISPPTAQRWLSILIATYQIHLVEPFYENLSSRIKKAPKLYFLDTGLASYLMGFKTPDLLPTSPQFPALFETAVITNWLKKCASQGEIPEHYYLCTQRQLEVDLLFRSGTQWNLVEVKYQRTITPKSVAQLYSAKTLLHKRGAQLFLAAPIPEAFLLKGVQVLPWDRCGVSETSTK